MKNFDNYTCENQLAFHDISMEIKTDEEWKKENMVENKKKKVNRQKYQNI